MLQTKIGFFQGLSQVSGCRVCRSGIGLSLSQPLLNVLRYCFEALTPFFHGCGEAVSVVSAAKFW